MSEKDNGGPAFPGLHPSSECRYSDEGMALRDYFAAKAMQAFIRNHQGSSLDDEKFDEMIARFSYELADAMLSARKQP